MTKVLLAIILVTTAGCRATPPVEHLVQPSVDVVENGTGEPAGSDTGEPEETPMSRLVDSENGCGIYGTEIRPGCHLDSKGRRLVRSWERCDTDADCDWVGSPLCPSRCGAAGGLEPNAILCQEEMPEPDRQCICWERSCTSSTCGIECRELQRQNASKK